MNLEVGGALTGDQRLEWIAPTIIILTTLFAPFGVYFFSLSHSTIIVSVHSLLWGIMPGESRGIGYLLVESYLIVGRGLFYGIFNIWFGIEVIRHFKDYNRRRMVLISGAISMIYPIFLAILSWRWLIYSATFVYLGPIPIQLVVGLSLSKLYGERKPLELWKSDSVLTE